MIPQSEDLVIGVDVDGVLSNTREHLKQQISNKYDTDISGPLTGDNPYIPEINSYFRDEVNQIMKHNTQMYKNLNPIEGSISACNSLAETYTVKILTHRVIENSDDIKELREITCNWLDSHGYTYDSFVYPTPKDKFDVDEIDVLIDDHIHNLETAIYDPLRFGIHFLRPHSVTNRKARTILASDYTSEQTPYDLATNTSKQWDIIQSDIFNV